MSSKKLLCDLLLGSIPLRHFLCPGQGTELRKGLGPWEQLRELGKWLSLEKRRLSGTLLVLHRRVESKGQENRKQPRAA